MKTICFLVSGGGGNLKFFYHAREKGLIGGFNLLAVADRECVATKFCQENNIDHIIIPYRQENNEHLLSILKKKNPDIIITTWHKILDTGIVNAFSGKIVNLHYSLLPAFSGLIGLEPIRRAYARGCRYIGPTCHFVTEGVDEGDILTQGVFSTDIPQEMAVVTMFRMGCIVLLAGTIKVLDIDLAPQYLQHWDTPHKKNAHLDILKSLFNEDFWRDLSNL